VELLIIEYREKLLVYRKSVKYGKEADGRIDKSQQGTFPFITSNN
jgi:hypothetical protein